MGFVVKRKRQRCQVFVEQGSKVRVDLERGPVQAVPVGHGEQRSNQTDANEHYDVHPQPVRVAVLNPGGIGSAPTKCGVNRGPDNRRYGHL